MIAAIVIVLAIVVLLLCAAVWLPVEAWFSKWRRTPRRPAQGRAEVMLMDQTPDPDKTQMLLALTPQTNAAQVYIAALAPGSRRTMRQALATIAAIAAGMEVDTYQFPWGKLRFEHVAALRAQLAERYEWTTANKMLSALRSTLKVAWQLGQMTAEEYQAAVDVKQIAGATLPAGRALDGAELARLIATCQADPSPAGVRDAAIVSILYGCGLRRAELAGLDVQDYDVRAGALRILGKRNKRRVAYLAHAEVALRAWLDARQVVSAHGPLFCHVSTEGSILDQARLSESGIYKMLQRRASEAGLHHLSPHDFRRTFVGDLLDAGVDIATVQQMAGHASVQTTARYDRRPDARKKEAAARLRLPGRG
jgi:site-specific recombinase XerD